MHQVFAAFVPDPRAAYPYIIGIFSELELALVVVH